MIHMQFSSQQMTTATTTTIYFFFNEIESQWQNEKKYERGVGGGERER
jgi:hypothetical protein